MAAEPKATKKSTETEAVRKPVEAWQQELATPAWLFAAARIRAKWPAGAELTAAEYRAAIRAAEEEVIR